jgi:hypothetical protein
MKQGFSYFFFIEGSGSVPLNNGSGSRRPKRTYESIDLDSDPQLCTVNVLLCVYPDPDYYIGKQINIKNQDFYCFSFFLNRN